MMKYLSLIGLLILLITNPAFAQRQQEKLNRGTIALLQQSGELYVSWRLLQTDPADISFNIYQGKDKLNQQPITTTTDYRGKPHNKEALTVKAIINGKEENTGQTVTIHAQPYLSIPLNIPPTGTTPDGVTYHYEANDASVGDVDGDGEYEIILKWNPSNAKDNSHSGYTGNVYLDAYKLDGRQLWRIDLGKNIRAGAHYTQFLVYDFDGDGKAEIACKTADGTIDGNGNVIGDAAADYRNKGGYILSGPEFLTVFEGTTGKALATTTYLPARDPQAGNNPSPEEMKKEWGDNYGNRIDRYVAAVAFLDGERPSMVFGRGYYTRLVRAAWDWRNGRLSLRWIFDTNSSSSLAAYQGQGNHSMTVGDIDGDGKDEVINGASVIDDNGKGLYTTGLGHGDALHMSDMNPTRPGMEIWQCYESPSSYGKEGMNLKDAATGQSLWGVNGENKDVGRAMAADIDPRYPGYELWGSVGGLYNVKGEKISDKKPSSINFAIWWDADLTRELLDHNRIDKWDPVNEKTINLFTATDCIANNGTKGTPALSADILGDWREEVIWRTKDNKELRIYSTTIPAQNRLVTLMQDYQYRMAIAWQNSAYNQPPHPSFYLGEGMEQPITIQQKN